jgi:hypothetical protein
MRYLVELIKEKEPEADIKTVEYVVSFLMKEGHMSYTVEYHYEIYSFFNTCMEHYKSLGLAKKCAISDTCEHFDITEQWLYKLLKKFKQTSLAQTV